MPKILVFILKINSIVRKEQNNLIRRATKVTGGQVACGASMLGPTSGKPVEVTPGEYYNRSWAE